MKTSDVVVGAIVLALFTVMGFTIGSASKPKPKPEHEVKVTYLKDSDLEVIVDSVFGVVCYKSNVGISCIQPDLKDAPLGDL